MVVFLIATFLAFFIPGDLVVERLNLKFLPRLALSFILGIGFWATQGLIFGYLNLRSLSYIYVTVAGLLWLKNHVSFPQLKFKPDWLAFGIIALGGLMQLSSIWLMGVRQGSDLLFCCRSVPDAIYHLSLTGELVRRFPPFEPGSTGIAVQNYHYLANLVMADLIRVFRLPLISVVYHYTPILLIILLGLSAMAFCEIIAAPKGYKYLLLFFLFFSGDINYLLIWLTTGKPNFSFTGFDSAALLLTGPPRAFSLVIFFGLLSFLALWIKKKKWLLGLIVAILTASLVGLKIYTAAAAFAGLAFLNHAWPFLAAVVLGLLIYLPVNAGAGGLVFAHFWRLEDYIVQAPLHLNTWELARQTFQAAGNWPRVLGFEFLFFLIYALFNFGTINLAFLPLKGVRQFFPPGIFWYLFAGQIILLILGVFFFQKTGGANTIQFLISLETIAAVLAAAVAWQIIKHLSCRWRYVFIALLIILTGTRVVNIFWENTFRLGDREQITVSSKEISALTFLTDKTPKDSVVAISPGLASKSLSLIVPLISNRPVFLAGVSDHGVPGLDQRIVDNQKLFTTKIGLEKINYLYVLKSEFFDANNSRLQRVFENEAVTIFRRL